MRILAVTLGLVMLASPVVGHELLIYTVIVNSEGAQPAEIPNGTLKEGDSAWFWMKDTTENATLIVEVEKDGATARSPVLQFECDAASAFECGDVIQTFNCNFDISNVSLYIFFDIGI